MRLWPRLGQCIFRASWRTLGVFNTYIFALFEQEPLSLDPCPSRGRRGLSKSSGASSQGVRAVAARADQRQVGGLVLFQQSRDFLVVRVRVQRFVVLVVVLVF